MAGGLELWDKRVPGKPVARSPLAWGAAGDAAADAARVQTTRCSLQDEALINCKPGVHPSAATVANCSIEASPGPRPVTSLRHHPPGLFAGSAAPHPQPGSASSAAAPRSHRRIRRLCSRVGPAFQGRRASPAGSPGPARRRRCAAGEQVHEDNGTCSCTQHDVDFQIKGPHRPTRRISTLLWLCTNASVACRLSLRSATPSAAAQRPSRACCSAPRAAFWGSQARPAGRPSSGRTASPAPRCVHALRP